MANEFFGHGAAETARGGSGIVISLAKQTAINRSPSQAVADRMEKLGNIFSEIIAQPNTIDNRQTLCLKSDGFPPSFPEYSLMGLSAVRAPVGHVRNQRPIWLRTSESGKLR